MEIILFIEQFFHRPISGLRQKGALSFKKSNGTRSGLSKLVSLFSGVFLYIGVGFFVIFVCLNKINVPVSVFMYLVFVACIKKKKNMCCVSRKNNMK